MSLRLTELNDRIRVLEYNKPTPSHAYVPYKTSATLPASPLRLKGYCLKEKFRGMGLDPMPIAHINERKACFGVNDNALNFPESPTQGSICDIWVVIQPDELSLEYQERLFKNLSRKDMLMHAKNVLDGVLSVVENPECYEL